MAIVTVVLGAAVILVGWRIGWWFSAQNANNQARVTQNGYSNQQSQRGQVEQQIANVDSETVTLAQARASGDTAGYITSLEGQRAATVSLACSAAAQVNGSLPADQAAWVSRNCQYGSIRPGSPYYVTGNGS
jgi:hypothetical protein